MTCKVRLTIHRGYFCNRCRYSCIPLPVRPTAMTSVVIPKKRDITTGPAYGDAIIKKDKALVKVSKKRVVILPKKRVVKRCIVRNGKRVCRIVVVRGPVARPY